MATDIYKMSDNGTIITPPISKGSSPSTIIFILTHVILTSNHPPPFIRPPKTFARKDGLERHALTHKGVCKYAIFISIMPVSMD